MEERERVSGVLRDRTMNIKIKGKAQTYGTVARSALMYYGAEARAPNKAQQINWRSRKWECYDGFVDLQR